MQIKQIKKINIPEVIAEELKKLIMSGDYKPGDKLSSSTKLAKDMGVGYTTLREALKRLEALNLIEIKQGKGIFVKDTHPDLFVVNPAKHPLRIDKKVLLDMLYVRKIVECEAVKLASQKATKDDLRRLESFLKDMKEEIEDTGRFIEHNVNFHVAVAQASGNIALTEVLTAITRLIAKEQQTVISKIPQAKERGYQYHNQIYKAIENKDEAKAVLLMSKHLEHVKKDIEKIFQS